MRGRRKLTATIANASQPRESAKQMRAAAVAKAMLKACGSDSTSSIQRLHCMRVMMGHSGQVNQLKMHSDTLRGFASHLEGFRLTLFDWLNRTRRFLRPLFGKSALFGQGIVLSEYAAAIGQKRSQKMTGRVSERH